MHLGVSDVDKSKEFSCVFIATQDFNDKLPRWIPTVLEMNVPIMGRRFSSFNKAE